MSYSVLLGHNMTGVFGFCYFLFW